MSSTDFVFFTGAFGSAYLPAVQGLIRSFSRHHDPDRLLVFSDQSINHSNVIPAELPALLSAIPDYYRHGERKNVFKFELFRRVFDWTPASTAVWIDADTVVLAPLTPHLVHGTINVVQLTRNPVTMYAFGNGMRAPASECASGNFYALPSVSVLDDISDLLRERLLWPDAEDCWSGDQFLLNHLVRRTTQPIHWLDFPGSGIFTVHSAFDLRAQAHHESCRADPSGTEVTYANERLVLLSHTKKLLDDSLMSGFREYPRPLRPILRTLYAWGDRPLLQRAISVTTWYLTVGAQDRLRQRLRRLPALVRLKRWLSRSPATAEQASRRP